MIAFIVSISFLYRRRQQTFEKSIEEIRTNHEKLLLATQLEIQEETFQHISREIHDNISLSLTLAKLHLNTLNWNDIEKSNEKVDTSITLLSQSIAGLSDISKSLNADIIIQDGLLKAIEDELQRIKQTGLFKLEFEVIGTPVYMDNQKELIIFRIVQEAFNNIIKHAEANNVKLSLLYDSVKLALCISDDGRGFNNKRRSENNHAGLKNMEARIKILKGDMLINSQPGEGTILSFNIPFE